jgi:hypothetical protein
MAENNEQIRNAVAVAVQDLGGGPVRQSKSAHEVVIVLVAVFRRFLTPCAPGHSDHGSGTLRSWQR